MRRDSLREQPSQGGRFFALHIRRGDFQYKDVKHSAAQILENLRFPNGTAIIPPGSMVYLSSDDPKGICENCFVNRQPCTSYAKGSKPVGCPEDPSWDAFTKFGWTLRFLDDYLQKGQCMDQVACGVHMVCSMLIFVALVVVAGDLICNGYYFYPPALFQFFVLSRLLAHDHSPTVAHLLPLTHPPSVTPGLIKDVNPNQHGMVESIVCTRAASFAGTYYSTFTGYIHRLRGYHGLGETTYYHTAGHVFHPQMEKSVGNGFSREWRAGWTDDAGGLI